EVLAGRIKERAVAWAIAQASVEEIDRLNIFRASLLAMRRAIETLAVAPEEVWIDGRHCPEISCRARAIVDGDALPPVISAASRARRASGVTLRPVLSALHKSVCPSRHDG